MSNFTSRNFIGLLGSLFLLPLTTAEASPIVSGTVIDAATGLPIDGATLNIANRANTTTTNASGGFSIDTDGTGRISVGKAGYRYAYRPSFAILEDSPIGNARYSTDETIQVELHQYKAGYSGTVLHTGVFKTPGFATLDSHTVSAGTFAAGDILFIDVVTLDWGDEPSFIVDLDGLQLMSGADRAGHGGNSLITGEFRNPIGTATIEGEWLHDFSHSAPWPAQSGTTNYNLSTSVGSVDWIQGSFTLSLSDLTGPGGSNNRWIEWQIVKLTPDVSEPGVLALMVAATFGFTRRRFRS